MLGVLAAGGELARPIPVLDWVSGIGVVFAGAFAWFVYFYLKDRDRPEPIAKLALAFVLGIGSAGLALLAYRALPAREQRLLGLGSVPGATLLDISVGYDLKGMQSAKVRSFLESCLNAGPVLDELRGRVPPELRRYSDVEVPIRLGDSITLSTFHGCPSQEIASICEFLMVELGFHVTVKMNPPMLGQDRLEHILHDRLGYRHIQVNPQAYATGLDWDEGVSLARRLREVGRRVGRGFGVKFSNNLEIVNPTDFLPAKQRVAYLSGQPMHPIALALAVYFRNEVGWDLPVSFSAGVDKKNAASVVGLDLCPVTSCTDLLRPGGYGRLHQQCAALEEAMAGCGAASIPDYIVKSGGHGPAAVQTALGELRARLRELGGDLVEGPGAGVPQGPGAGLAATGDLEEELLATLTLRDTRIQETKRTALSETLAAGISQIKDHLGPRQDPRLRALHEQVEGLGERIVALAARENGRALLAETLADPRYRWERNRAPAQRAENASTPESCVSVCPNNAIFVLRTGTGPGEAAVYADFCNECGVCDACCLEGEAPYKGRPVFFGTEETWRIHEDRDGFVVQRVGNRWKILGRLQGREYSLDTDLSGGPETFADGVQSLQLEGGRPESAHDLNLRPYHVMRTVLAGALDRTRIHAVNAPFVKERRILSETER